MPRTNNKQRKLHIKKGDRVRVIAGNQKGSEGKVLKVFPERQRVIIEGVNLRVRHTRPSQTNPQGGRVQREMPIHASNVMPLDSSGNPTRIGRKRIEDPETGSGRWIRYAKTTGEELDR
ncbi:MAG: 50S ribosomal protein L24 [Rhodothermales bacterium]